MNKPLVMGLCAVLLCTCGGGSNELPDIEGVEVGSGPTLSLSTSKGSTEDLVEDTLFAVAVAVAKGVDESTTHAAELDQIRDICQNHSAELDYGPVTINGDGGSATISGSGDATRSGDTGQFEQAIEGTMSVYGYSSVALGKKFTMTGDVAYSADGSVTKGLDPFCAAFSAPHPDAEVQQNLTETLSGSLTIAGGFGAAVTFQVTAITDDAAATVTYEGTAAVKSGDETTQCAISGSVSKTTIDANTFEALTIDC